MEHLESGIWNLKFLLLFAVCCLLFTGLAPSAQAQDTPLTNKFPVALNSADSLGRTADGPTATLNATINSSVTTFVVTGTGAAFPSSGLSLLINSEIILCTTRTGTTFSGCTRGAKGSTATTHVAGATVRSPLLSAQRDVLVAEQMAIEAKLGKGDSNAVDAASGYSIVKQADGTTKWAAQLGSQGPQGVPGPDGTGEFLITAYASLANAVSTLGSTPATLVIDSNQAVANDLTIPATLTLRFVNAGGIQPANTKIVNILSDGSNWPIRQIFYNSLSGQGAVSFSGNTVQRDFQVAWWGADTATAGAATSAALNAAFVAWPDGSTMHLSPRKTYTHSGITIDRKFQATLIGNDSDDGYIDAVSGPQFKYNGTDGGNAITISNCYASTFKGFASYGAVTNSVPGTTGATRNLYITMVASGYPPTSSQNIFSSLFIPANNTRVDYIAADVANASGTNNEFHRFRHCKFIGGQQAFPNQTGIGIRLGHANVKHVVIDASSFDSFATAIYSESGSFRAYSPTFNANSAVVAGAISDGGFIMGADGENNTQLINALQGYGSVTFELLYSRFDALKSGQAASGSASNAPVISAASGLNLIIDGCAFGALGTFTSDFILNTVGTSRITWGTNIVYNESNAALGFGVSDLLKGLATFESFTGTPGHALQGSGGPIVGGNTIHQTSFQGVNSAAAIRALIGVQLDDDSSGSSGLISAKDSISVGDQGQLEIAGLARPMRPTVSYVGANDATQAMILAIIARDANGRRTIQSILNQSIAGNSTLSGSNFVRVTWPKVPGATDYLILQFSGGTWRSIATATPSGTNTEIYDIVANPAGAFTYTLPTFNEAAWVQFNSPYRRRTTGEKAAAYAVVGNDETVLINTSINFTVTLPAATGRTGETHTFKVTTAGGFTATINGGGTNIDGAATYAGLNALYKFLTVQSNGTIWMITGSN